MTVKYYNPFRSVYILLPFQSHAIQGISSAGQPRIIAVFVRLDSKRRDQGNTILLFLILKWAIAFLEFFFRQERVNKYK